MDELDSIKEALASNAPPHEAWVADHDTASFTSTQTDSTTTSSVPHAHTDSAVSLASVASTGRGAEPASDLVPTTTSAPAPSAKQQQGGSYDSTMTAFEAEMAAADVPQAPTEA